MLCVSNQTLVVADGQTILSSVTKCIAVSDNWLELELSAWPGHCHDTPFDCI